MCVCVCVCVRACVCVYYGESEATVPQSRRCEAADYAGERSAERRIATIIEPRYVFVCVFVCVCVSVCGCVMREKRSSFLSPLFPFFPMSLSLSLSYFPLLSSFPSPSHPRTRTLRRSHAIVSAQTYSLSDGER